MKILFMDDAEYRHQMFRPLCIRHDAHLVYTLEEALSLLKSNVYDIVFLDHDLEGGYRVLEEKGTGTMAARFIASLPENRRPKLVVVHSKYEEGAKRMMGILENAGVNAERHFFGINDFGHQLKQS